MLSWILRHRSRLQVVYGLSETPPLAGRRFAEGGRAPLGLPVDGGSKPIRPGLLRRRAGGQIELRPMPRRVG